MIATRHDHIPGRVSTDKTIEYRFVKRVTETTRNEASAVPSAHFDYVSGRMRKIPPN